MKYIYVVSGEGESKYDNDNYILGVFDTQEQALNCLHNHITKIFEEDKDDYADLFDEYVLSVTAYVLNLTVKTVYSPYQTNIKTVYLQRDEKGYLVECQFEQEDI